MTLPVLIRRAAELDLMGIEDWYERQRPGLGHEFREAVDAAVTRIADNPLAYPERYRGARRALLRRFPYVIWYRPLENLVIVSRAFTASEIPVQSTLGFGDRRTPVFSRPRLASLAAVAEPCDRIGTEGGPGTLFRSRLR